MLAQEDLAEIGLSSPSEQVAYLLVERATLRERLEAAERALGDVSFTHSQTDIQHQRVQITIRMGSLSTCPGPKLIFNVCVMLPRCQFATLCWRSSIGRIYRKQFLMQPR